MQRRTALKFIASAGLAACPICSNIASATGPIEDYKLFWDYSGDNGPANWGKLKPEYKTCGLGAQQSPVNLTGPIQADMRDIAIYWRAMPLNVVNNGHTIEQMAPAGSFISFRQARYDLDQFHFHHPSEHVIEGEAFSMEVHFVHKSAAGALLVISCLIVPGQESRALAPIWDHMPMELDGTATSAALSVRPMDLLPQDRGYFHYMGSLTTPPCSETVSWLIFAQQIEASPAQIAKFAKLFPHNARPAQLRNRRFYLSNF